MGKTKKRYRKKHHRRTKKMYGGEKPTLSSNVGKVANLGADILNTGVSTLLTKIGEKIGYDANKPMDQNIKTVTDKAKNFTNTLTQVANSPEGQQIMNESADLIKKGVVTLKPGLEEAINVANDLIRKEIPIVGNMANDAVLMVPGIGQIVGAVEEIGNVAQASEAAVESAAKMTKVSADALVNLEQHKDQAMSILDKGKNLFNRFSDGLNQGASNIIDSTQQYIDKKIDVPNQMNNSIQMNNSNQMNNFYQTGGRKLQSYHNEALMIGGRIINSRNEFLKKR